MALHLDDFAAFYANWTDKPSNIKAMAQYLNLGLDSFVFLDDNPAERALMRRERPEVTVPEVSGNPDEFITAMVSGKYFEATTLSAEDLNRSRQYRSNALRDSFKQETATLDDFLAGLKMESSHGTIQEIVLPRVVQLLGKTNQFNLTTRRHNEAAVRRLADESAGWTQYFRLKDIFDDNGLVGVLITVPSDREKLTWVIDTWLMSCRVIGRQMEQFMFNTLVQAAKARGIQTIRGTYLPTPKNGMVSNLLDNLGFSLMDPSGEGVKTYALQVSQASPQRADLIQDLGQD
jgi:FkbH-like protein